MPAAASYKVLENWHPDYDGNLRVILPNTYGIQGFLRGAPSWLASWTGIHIESGVPEEGVEIAIAGWENRGRNRPTVKLSDNPAKAIGPVAEVARYKRVFDVGAQVAEPVLV